MPRVVVEKMHAFLAYAGRRGCEGFTAWAGVQDATTFYVKEVVIPRQTARRSENGLCVLIDADELFALNRWLYEKEMTLIAQIHSHPTDAYHSELDDEIPIATTQGCLSIVVPDFASAPFELENCAAFRLSSANVWEKIAPKALIQLVNII